LSRWVLYFRHGGRRGRHGQFLRFICGHRRAIGYSGGPLRRFQLRFRHEYERVRIAVAEGLEATFGILLLQAQGAALRNHHAEGDINLAAHRCKAENPIRVVREGAVVGADTGEGGQEALLRNGDTAYIPAV
jgi:hypothetical protein